VQRLMAVYPHRFGFLAGWLAARSLGVPFVAYMHDLFAETSISGSRVKRAFWSWVDRSALEAAELVVVPTREFAEHYRRRQVKPCWVLPHCCPEDVVPCEAPRGAPLKLLYAGSVYQAHEDAVAALLEAIDSSPGVEITFLSNRNAVVADDRVQWVSRCDALKAMSGAQVLVVALGQRTPYPQEVHGCFPSKIVDYLAMGRPILAVVPSGCFVERLVSQARCGVVVTSQSRAAIVQALETLHDVDRRRQMGVASRRLSERLSSDHWMGLLSDCLAYGPPAESASPLFAAQVSEVPTESLEVSDVIAAPARS